MPSKSRKDPSESDNTLVRSRFSKNKRTVIEPMLDGYHSKPNGKPGNTKHSKMINIQVTPGEWRTK